MNLFDAIFASSAPEASAIWYERREISYRELQNQILRHAGGLSSLGVVAGDRVALLLHDSPEFIESFISICSSGAIAVPINMALKLDDQRAILNDCAAQTLMAEPEMCRSLLTGEQLRLRHLKEIICVCRNEDHDAIIAEMTRLHHHGPRVTSLNELLAGSKPDDKFPVPAGDAPAFILYTSGSTGEPKGAVHRQADILYTNETYCHAVLNLQPGDRLFSSSRLPFAYGLGNALSFPLLNAMTTVLCREKPTPEVLNRVFNQARPTIFFGVPVVYNLLLEHYQQHRALDCSSLRLCISAGEALPAQLGEDWQRTFGVPVLDGIGSTEMLHMFMSNHSDGLKYGSSGKLLQGYQARLLDEQGEPLPAADEGNLWIKGDSAATGYWERPEESARTFVDGWVRTGDIYQCDEEGYWYHKGRSDDCFKSSGQWVSPVEVEGVLLRHKGVSQAAVVEGFDAGGLPCACAFVIRHGLESDSSELEADLRELSRAWLARFKQPRCYFFVEELPYTATGKIQRFKLRQQLRPLR